MEYASPGDAFSSQLERSLLLREESQQRAVQTQLAVQREQRQAMRDQMEADQARAALAEKRRDFDETQKDKRKAAFEKSVTTMVPGDIASPDMVEQAHQLGLSHLFPAEMDAVVKAAPAPAGIAANPDEVLPPMPEPTPQAPLPQKFIGTPGQRKEADENAALDKFIADLPEDSPERQALQFNRLTGRNAPAGMFKGGKADGGIPLVRVGQGGNVVERKLDGKWVPVDGDAPLGSHFIAEPPPKDNSAGNAKATAAAERARQQAFTDLDTLGKPLESSLQEYEKVGAALNQRTAQADNDLAPLILKATVGGMGSGFRMTEAEINKTMGAGTKWEALQRSLNKWSTDPQHFVFPEDQREAMRNLAKAIRAKTYDSHRKVQDMRYKIAESDDPKEILRLRTQLRDSIFPPADESSLNDPKGSGTTGPDGKKLSAKEYLDKLRSGK